MLEDSIPLTEGKGEINVFENEREDFRISYPNSARTNKERALKSASDELNLISIQKNLVETAKSQILRRYSLLYEKGFTNGRSRRLVLLSIIKEIEGFEI